MAIVTPFSSDRFDERSFRDHLEWLISQGVDGVVVLGSTGEAATLDDEERAAVLVAARDHAAGRIPLMAGVGTLDTRRTVRYAEEAERLGYSALLVVCPPYLKPQPDGLRRHFTSVHDATGIPLVLYNVPGRTGVNMTPETVIDLARLPRVRGLKEAAGDIRQVAELRRRLDLAQGEGLELDVLSGDDDLFFESLCLGASGIISVTANVVPAQMKALYSAFQAGDLAAARSIHLQLLPLVRGLFIETNPVPVKAVLHRMNRMSADVRLPLAPLTRANAERITALCQEYRLATPPRREDLAYVGESWG